MDFNNTSLFSPIEENTNNNNNNNGSMLTKQQRSDDDQQQQQQQQQEVFVKSLRSDYFDQPNKTLSSSCLRSDSLLSLSPASNNNNINNNNNNMLSFSSTNTNTKNGNNSLFSFYQPSPTYIRNTTGYGYGGLQTGMQMPVSRYKGPFTPSQWMELEHQALIYKHFVANVPVPSNLLNPLRKSINSFLFPGSTSSTAYAPNSYGWGSFHLGFSGNSDPEPGRCRRTDGKKWRCSRDAVPDQKYCERHINRGRHRSRKPVEGQNGHAVSGPTPPKVGQLVSSSSQPVSTTRATTAALSGAAVHNQFKTLNNHSAATETPINRTQESQAFALGSFSIPKEHNTVEESSDSLMYATNYNSLLDQGAQPNTNPLPNFVDQWSKDLNSDWTQLSMSIPMVASDFSSSSNSPAQEKLSVPPLGLTPEFDLDLDSTHKLASNWIPISWENSMGGPLGEVLNRTSSSSGMNSKNVSSGSEMWDAVNYQMGSSPTGVLQKTTFVSLSNSSSGSSPKRNKKDENGGSLCDELLLSTLVS